MPHPMTRFIALASLMTILVGVACGPDLESDANAVATDQLAGGLIAVLEYADREMFSELPMVAVAHSADMRAEDIAAIVSYTDKHDLLYTKAEVCVTGEEAICQRVDAEPSRWVQVENVSIAEDNSLRVSLVWFDQIQDLEDDSGLMLGSAEFLAVWTSQGWKVNRESGSLEQTESESMPGLISYASTTMWSIIPQQTCGKVGGITESTNCKGVTQDEYQSIRDLMANPYDRWTDYLNWARCDQIISMVESAWESDKWFWYDTAAGDTNRKRITGWHYSDQLGLRRGRGAHQVMTTAMHESYHHAGFSHSASFTRKVGWWSQNCIRL